MKCVMVMFDTLSRHFLPNYNPDTFVHAPNFRRLSERTVTFDNSYVCSMPCMPARRDFHSGRPNFLHRAWGPLEPFDDSVPQMLAKAGVHSHLATDHYHYFEDGGATYHSRYDTWEFFRGHEGDPWKGMVADPPQPADAIRGRKQDWTNRLFMQQEMDQPQPCTFKAGLDFIERNHDQDNWLCHIETFDPHEPFFTQQHYKDLYAEHYENYRGRFFDWPDYQPVRETPEEVEHARFEYAALMSMCDVYMGQIIDAMDRLNMWQDTMLVVWTDHGFLLGEHDCWAKCWMPFYQEIAHTPFWVWDPRSGKKGERRQALVQPSIDLGPTLLDFFGLEATADMTGCNLRDTIDHDQKVRDAAIFGIAGGQINITDGRHVYMRATQDWTVPNYEYTLMPTRMKNLFQPKELVGRTQLHDGFSFTKGCPVLQIGGASPRPEQTNPQAAMRMENLLWDLQNDYQQQHPLDDPALESQLCQTMARLMQACDAPTEKYQRYGLTQPV